MTDTGIEPTYVGTNENLVFVVPKELFSMSAGPAEVIDRETAKIFSKYIRGTFKGFQDARKTKYNNENNTKTDQVVNPRRLFEFPGQELRETYTTTFSNARKKLQLSNFFK